MSLSRLREAPNLISKGKAHLMLNFCKGGFGETLHAQGTGFRWRCVRECRDNTARETRTLKQARSLGRSADQGLRSCIYLHTSARAGRPRDWRGEVARLTKTCAQEYVTRQNKKACFLVLVSRTDFEVQNGRQRSVTMGWRLVPRSGTRTCSEASVVSGAGVKGR